MDAFNKKYHSLFIIVSFTDPPLELLQSPINSTILELSTASFQCRVSDTDATISWILTQQDQTMISIAPGEEYSVSSVNGLSTLVIISALYGEHNGRFTCTASRGEMPGSVSASAWLDVQGKLCG